MHRDFTYIDDIINGVVSSIKIIMNAKCLTGNSRSENLMDMIGYIEQELGQAS